MRLATQRRRWARIDPAAPPPWTRWLSDARGYRITTDARGRLVHTDLTETDHG